MELPLDTKEKNFVKKIILAALIVGAVASPAFAAGMSTHQFMTETALEKVSDPELKNFLEAHREMVLTGTVFPDTGFALRYTVEYGKKPDYGEFAHWPPFFNGYLAYIRAHCPQPFDGHCQDLIAHLMGVAAHTTEDGAYDEIFLPLAAKMDPATLTLDTDVVPEFLLIARFHRWKDVPKYYIPTDDLYAIFSSMGLDYSRKEIILGNKLLPAATTAERVLVWHYWDSDRKKIAWTMDHIYSAPGGIDFSATVVAKYWEILWRMLDKNEAPPLMVSTFPEAGAVSADPDSPITVFFSAGKISRTVNSSTFIVAGPDGKAVDGQVKNYGLDATNVSTFIPKDPLAPGATYTVTLTTGIYDLTNHPGCERFGNSGHCLTTSENDYQGKPIASNYSWTFTTGSSAKP